MVPVMNHHQSMAMGYLLFKVSLDRTNAPCLKALTPSNSASVGLIEADAEPFSEEQLSVNTGVDPVGSTVGFWQPVNLKGWGWDTTVSSPSLTQGGQGE